jgi:hypothetical protein
LEPTGGLGLDSRWVARGRAGRDKLPRGRRELRECDLKADEPGQGFAIDGMPDPRAVPPLKAMIVRENHRKANVRIRGGSHNWPKVLLGLGSPWPIARNPDGSCGGCHDRYLPSLYACLWCDRTGVDAWLDTPNVIRETRIYRPDPSLAGGFGKRRVKTSKSRKRRKVVGDVPRRSSFDLKSLRDQLSAG